ncbi:hypothetical protein DFO59_10990 [Pseudomonas fluorescens]|nr:hypothetical protein DFO59_10990 [Pseudomonas fluorescens]
MNVMSYQGYAARIEYSEEDGPVCRPYRRH